LRSDYLFIFETISSSGTDLHAIIHPGTCYPSRTQPMIRLWRPSVNELNERKKEKDKKERKMWEEEKEGKKGGRKRKIVAYYFSFSLWITYHWERRASETMVCGGLNSREPEEQKRHHAAVGSCSCWDRLCSEYPLNTTR
jgi:hypothetical protein